jgi:inner membrane protein
VLSALLVFTLFRDSRAGYGEVFGFLFLSALSHPLLDMLTNGGLGVALFAPFSKERFFFPWRPVEVSPIGFNFFSEWGARVLLSEFRWVWLPAAAFFVFGVVIRRYGGSGLGA